MHTTHTFSPTCLCLLGTVAEPSDILQVVLENQQSRQYKSDKKGYVNMPVGKVRKHNSVSCTKVQTTMYTCI